MSWSTSLAAAVALAMTRVSNAALAQSSAKDASDHHRAGVAYAKSGKWGDAVRELDEAYALDASPIRLYDVAQVCLEARQYVRARDAYAKVVDNPALTAEQRQRARAGLETAKANVGRVRVAVVGAMPSDVVSVDGARLHTDAVDVDPGKHVVTLIRGGATTEVAVDVVPRAESTSSRSSSACAIRRSIPRAASPSGFHRRSTT